MHGFKTYKKDIQSTVKRMQHLMTELKNLENAFLTHEEALWVISEFANDWEYWQAPDGSYKYVSPSCEKITGYLPEDFYQNKDILEEIIVPGDWHQWSDHAHTLTTEKEVEPLEFEIRTKGGKTKWIQHVCQPVINSAGENLGVRGSNRDISSMKELQNELKHMAGHDELTGLANRALFMEHLEQTLKSAERDRTHFIVAFIDLDKFKSINDTHGHFAGDEVLKRVAIDLRKVVRKNDIIARFGGDEFVGIFKVNVQDDIHHLKEKILNTIKTDIVCSRFEIVLSLSIGMAMYPQDGKTIDMLMNKADKAMYAMKEQNAASELNKKKLAAKN